MRRYVWGIAGVIGGLLLSGCLSGEGKVVFGGQAYYLQYSAGNSEEWLNEYLPKGSDFASYQTMFAVRSYDSLQVTPQEAGSSVIYKLLEDYPGSEYGFFPGENGDAGLHFVIVQPTVAEFNLFRFTTQNGHPYAMQFVYREPLAGTDAQRGRQKLVETVNKNLIPWTVEMMSRPVPAIIRTP